MAKIKALNVIAGKWARNAAAAGESYREGLQGADWEGPARGSASAYATGVQQAIGRGAYEKGIGASGNAKWQQASTGKGVARFGEGVQGAQAAYQEGFGPYAQTIASVSLPPKGPKGAEGNIERVRAIARALRAAKLSRG